MSQAIKRLFQRKKQSDTAADQKDYASAAHLDLSSLPSRSPAVEEREETNQPIEIPSPMAAVSPIASASNRRLPLLTDEERQRARWLIAEHARKSLSMPHENPQIPSHYTSRHENIQNRGDHLSNQARDLGSTAEEFAGLALDLRRKVEDEITSRRERL
jgi:hypothetical protein